MSITRNCLLCGTATFSAVGPYPKCQDCDTCTEEELAMLSSANEILHSNPGDWGFQEAIIWRRVDALIFVAKLPESETELMAAIMDGELRILEIQRKYVL